MSGTHRIFGSELSPYSVKVRSYFRYKGIPHEWLERNASTMGEFQKYAKLPLVPLVVTPDARGLQDSTPIIEAIEARFPEPSIHPQDEALAFLSALLEEFGDEWGNKWMFHYRWARPADQDSAAERIARSMRPDATGPELAPDHGGREGAHGGSRRVRRLEPGHGAADRGQLPRRAEDPREAPGKRVPTCSARAPRSAISASGASSTSAGPIRRPAESCARTHPHVTAWVERMLEPKAEGDFEGWDALAPTLLPLLERQVGVMFLPWSDANAKAIAAGEEEMVARMPLGHWRQKPQKYHARSLAELRKKYAAVSDKARLDPVLERAGCLRWLAAAA